MSNTILSYKDFLFSTNFGDKNIELFFNKKSQCKDTIITYDFELRLTNYTDSLGAISLSFWSVDPDEIIKLGEQIADFGKECKNKK